MAKNLGFQKGGLPFSSFHALVTTVLYMLAVRTVHFALSGWSPRVGGGRGGGDKSSLPMMTTMMRTTTLVKTTRTFLTTTTRTGKIHHHHRQKKKSSNDDDVSFARFGSTTRATSKGGEKEEKDFDNDANNRANAKVDHHGVHVYILQRNQCDAPETLQKYEDLLSRRELESIRIDSLVEETRKERLQTRAMVRTVLSSYLGRGTKTTTTTTKNNNNNNNNKGPAELEFTFNEKGKPFLSNREGLGNESSLIQFSVSHSKNIIAMAVTTDGRRVGIDCELEKRRTKDACLKLAKRYFRKGEAVERIERELMKEEDMGRKMFVRYWCLCESYVKALGVGISGRPFRNFDIEVVANKKGDAPHEDVALLESDPETFGRWRFQLFRETPVKTTSTGTSTTENDDDDERSIVAVCVEDNAATNAATADDADEKIVRRPPIVTSIKRIRPLVDDDDAKEIEDKRSGENNTINTIEILAASSS